MNETPSSTDRRAVLESALRTIGEMQSKLRALESEKREPIAIIGMGCRFPGGADTPDAFWDLLRAGVDAVQEVPSDRWDIDALYDPDPDRPGKMYTRMGTFLERVADFDASFFGMSGREALKTDPQQRLAAEVSWEALEDAGINPKSLGGDPAGVFLGITNSDYARIIERAGAIDAYHLTGNCLNFAAGRLAYFFGLRGPAMAIDTACSSSGVSVHLACQSLRNRECNLALAGGVNLILSPEISITSTKARTLSPDGHCRTFDAEANGYVRGEGCGIFILKRLSDALADRDRIHAVIRGSAVNQDGATSGITVPNKAAQAEVIRQALERAGVEPNQVDYVESHGTGTPLGDPIEVRALASVYSKGRLANQPLVIGAVKTNIGHLESAAGIAGLMKAVLALRHGYIPPNLHLKKLNPAISLEEIPAIIPQQLMPWPKAGSTRRAASSSFGGSGTIFHAILEEAPPSALKAEADSPAAHQLFCLSAESPAALQTLAERYQSRLTKAPAETLRDVCYTTNSGRAHFNHRLAIIGSNAESVQDRLKNYQRREDCAGLFRGECSGSQKPKVVFLFTGQGGQYVNMARKLYQDEPVFKEIIDRCDGLLRECLPVRLKSVLYPESDGTTPLNETQYTHVAMFAVQYGLAALWQSWGIEPALAMGHSVGEVVAATVAGYMSFEDGLNLMCERGRLVQSLPGNGLMASLLADAELVEDLISPYSDHVSIAAVNGPESTVISGERNAVEAILRKVQGRIKTKTLNISRAFHSPLMDAALRPLEEAAKRATFASPRVPLFSSVYAEQIQDHQLNAGYWGLNLRNTVRFSEAIGKIYEKGYHIFLEIGPAPILVNMASQCIPVGAGVWLPSVREDKDDSQQMLETLGQLYVNGGDINWKGFYQNRPGRKVTLPTYPFQRERYWVDAPYQDPGRVDQGRVRSGTVSKDRHPLLGSKLPCALPIYEQELNVSDLPFLDEHRVFDKPVFPATAYVEMALAAAGRVFKGTRCAVKNLVISQPLILGAEESTKIQTILAEIELEGASTFRILSLRDKDPEESWTLHAAGELEPIQSETSPERLDLTAIRSRCKQQVDVSTFYESSRSREIQFGPSFQRVRELQKSSDEVLAFIDSVALLTDQNQAYRVDPAFLDACLQPVATLLPPDQTYMPHRFHSFQLFRPVTGPVWSHIALRQSSAHSGAEIAVDVNVVDGSGQRFCELRDLVLRPARNAAPESLKPNELKDWLYELKWEEVAARKVAKEEISKNFPDPATIAHQLEHDASQYFQDAGMQQFTTLLPSLEALSTQYVSDTLLDLGWDPARQRRFTIDSLADDLGILHRYRRFLARMLEMLCEDGQLEHDGLEWRVLKALVAANPEAELSVLLNNFPQCDAELRLTGRCGRHLARAMKGEINPLEVLFPDGSLSDIEKLYKGSPYFSFYNKLATEAVLKALRGLPAGRRVRILEIGGGTGSVTSNVVPMLPAGQIEYVFTDVSSAFFSKAREKFADYPFVSYKVLDIEREPSNQGFVAHDFDLVIAANVLHATEDLRRTLQNVRGLMAPHGLLLLLEATGRLRFADVIVGLTEGWWRFTDTDLRPNHALLGQQEWIKLLGESGFESVVSSPDSLGRPLTSNQQIMLARAPVTPHESCAAAQTKKRKWLLVGEASALRTGLCKQLELRGEPCAVIPFAADRSEFSALIRDTVAVEPSIDEVVYFAAKDDASTAPQEWPALKLEIRKGCETLLELIASLVAAGEIKAKHLRIVTRGSETFESQPASLSQHSIAALTGTIALEYPELQCMHIDLDPAGNPDEIEGLIEEIVAGEHDQERHIALRGGRRFVARLVHSEAASELRPQAVREERLYQLTVSPPGLLDNLRIDALERRAPGQGEIEIEVHASGIGFRDVLIALGQYPGRSQTLGYECAGRIVRVGPGTVPFATGQRVIAIHPGGFRSFLTISAGQIAVIPEDLSDEEAATIPSAFLTAQYALHRLGAIQAGERILIHAGAGGVGLAAIQIARNAGAEIFATAGSEEKREYLKSLGVHHVMNSRSLDFGRRVMETTNGRGVDLVLNCLSGEFIRESFSIMAANGRFLELGKIGIWGGSQVIGLKKNLKYFPIDLSLEFEKDPDLARSLFHEVLTLFVDGILKPLPKTLFAIDEAAAAFRYMAQGKHTGKIVLTHLHDSRPLRSDDAPTGEQTIAIRPDGAYLVTGGFAGLGLLTAQWLVERGARTLVLLGRREPGEEALHVFRELEAKGARIEIIQQDVSDMASLRELFARFGHTLPALRGILHSAGTVDDGVLSQQTWERFEKVMAAKVDGSWHLHTLSLHQPLDFFVLFSSVVSVLGSAAQGNHVAACAFQDALAHYRRNLGLPTLSINWGPWAETGAATRGTVGERLRMKGFRFIDSQRGIRILERLMLQDRVQVGAMSVDWKIYADSLPSGHGTRMLSHVYKAETRMAVSQQAAAPVMLLEQIRQAPSRQRRQILQAHVRDQAIKVLGLSASYQLDPDQGLATLGMDSLITIEFKNRLQASLGKPLSSTIVFDHPTVSSLAEYLDQNVLSVGDDSKPATAEKLPITDSTLSEVALMSEKEAEAMLAKELSS